MTSHKRLLQSGLGIGLIAVAVLLAGCLSQPPRETRADDRGTVTASDQRLQVIRTASAQIGTPYRYGGSRPGGFDCSGLVQFTHARAGVRIPRTTGEQWQSALPLRRSHLLPGDLLFFRIGDQKPRHVGIYEGGGVFIHAPSSGKSVTRASLDNPYWRTRWVGSGTFL